VFTPICKECNDTDVLCECGHKRLVHSDRMGCSYCRFIQGRKYLHKFKAQKISERDEVNKEISGL